MEASNTPNQQEQEQQDAAAPSTNGGTSGPSSAMGPTTDKSSSPSRLSPSSSSSSSSSSSCSDDGSDSDGFVVVANRQDFVVVKPSRSSPATAVPPAAIAAQDGRRQHQAAEKSASGTVAATAVLPTRSSSEASTTAHLQPPTTAGLPPPLHGRVTAVTSTSVIATTELAPSVLRAVKAAPAELAPSVLRTIKAAPAEDNASATPTSTVDNSSGSYPPIPAVAPGVFGGAAPWHNHKPTTSVLPPFFCATGVTFGSNTADAELTLNELRAAKLVSAEDQPSAAYTSAAGSSRNSRSSRSICPPMPTAAPIVFCGAAQMDPAEDQSSASSTSATCGSSSSSSSSSRYPPLPPLGPRVPRVFGGAAPAPSTTNPTTPVPSEAPPLPPHYVERSDLLKGAVGVLTTTTTSSSSDGGGSFYALLGKSGAGKSTLASAVVRDPTIRNAFRGGIFWVNLARAGSSTAPTTSATAARSTTNESSATAERGAGRVAGGVGAGGGRAGGGRLRALLRVLLTRVCGTDPFPVPPSANGDVAGDTYDGSRLPASAGEASRQLASINSEVSLRRPPFRSRRRRLLVLDDFGGETRDHLNGTLAELGRAGFALLVVCKEPGVLSLLRGRWVMVAVPPPPTTAATEPRALADARSGRRHSDFLGRHQRQPVEPGTAYFSVLQTMVNFDAMDMLLTRARRGRDAAATAEAGEWGEKDGSAGDTWAASAAAMRCATELAKRWGDLGPLTLALVNAVAAAGGKSCHSFGDSSPFSCERYSWIERVLCDTGADVERPPSARDDGGYGGLSHGGGVGLRRAIDLAFDTLLDDATKECFVKLGVLAEGTVAPSDMLSNLWDQGIVQTARTIEELSGISFLHETQPGSSCYRVHDPVLALAKTVLHSDAPRGGGRSGVADKQKTNIKERDEEEDTQDDDKEIAATGTRKAAVAAQARYLSRINTLLRFSGGGSGTSVGAVEAARRCGETVLLGGLPALAALWRSLEDVRWSQGGGGGGDRDLDQEGEAASATAGTESLVGHAYGAALEGMGVCVEAASGYWAAAKLMQLHGLTVEAKRMAQKSVRLGNALLNAGSVQAAQCRSDAALLRVHKDMGNEVVMQYERWLGSAKSTHGPSHPAVAFASSSLAGVLLEQEKLFSAGARYREALWVLEVSLGDDHPLLANTLIDIAEAKSKSLLQLPPGRTHQESRPQLLDCGGEMCSRALSIYDGDLGVMEVVDSRGQATSLVRLARLLKEQGNIKAAERLCRRALRVLEKSNMGYHVQAGAVLVDLAGLLHNQEERLAEATELLRKAVDIGESWFEKDPAHEKLALWRNKLAKSLTRQGKHIEAAAQYLKVVERCNQQPSIDQATIVDAAHFGLATLVEAANFDELLERTTAYRDDCFGDSNRTTVAPTTTATAAAAATAATEEAPGEETAAGVTAGSTKPATGGDDHAAVATGDDNNEDDECGLGEGSHQEWEKHTEGDEGEEEGEEEEHQQENVRRENQDDDDVSLEAAAFYLYANNPRSLHVDASSAMDDNDRELQQALSLSLREAATLGVDQ
eukprot:g4686.t1